MKNLIRNVFAVIGLLGFFIVIIFFSQNTKIKIEMMKTYTYKYMGIGDDYSGFVANSFDDFKEILVRGIIWRFKGKDYQNINLKFSFKDSKILDSQRAFILDNEYQAKGTLVLNNDKSFKTKLKAKGDRLLHRENFSNMSYKVDIRGEERLFGLEEFSLQKPILRNYGWEMLIAKIASKEGLISPRIIPINLSINGNQKGVYFIEESFTSESLEFYSRKVGPIFSIDDEV
jgi:hypothetical protein